MPFLGRPKCPNLRKSFDWENRWHPLSLSWIFHQTSINIFNQAISAHEHPILGQDKILNLAGRTCHQRGPQRPGLRLGAPSLWNKRTSFVLCIWFVYGLCLRMVYVWFTYGLCVVYVWFMCGLCMYIYIYIQIIYIYIHTLYIYILYYTIYTLYVYIYI